MLYDTDNSYVVVTKIKPEWIEENHPIMNKLSFTGQSGRVFLELPVGVPVPLKSGEILNLKYRGDARTLARVETNFPLEKSCIHENGFGDFRIGYGN